MTKHPQIQACGCESAESETCPHNGQSVQLRDFEVVQTQRWVVKAADEEHAFRLVNKGLHPDGMKWEVERDYSEFLGTVIVANGDADAMIRAFFGELRKLDPDEAMAIAANHEPILDILGSGDFSEGNEGHTGPASDLIADLVSALNKAAPAGRVFGPYALDPNDWGWWNKQEGEQDEQAKLAEMLTRESMLTDTLCHALILNLADSQQQALVLRAVSRQMMVHAALGVRPNPALVQAWAEMIVV